MRDDWIEKEIGVLFETVTGNTPSKKDFQNYGVDLPFIKPPELENMPISNAQDFLSEIGASKARVLPEGSVLVTCIGNLGRTGIAKYPVAFNQQINAIKPLKGVESRFTFYQCQNPFFRRDLEQLSSATTVPIVNKGKFNSIAFKLAPLPEQRAIVAKIEHLFSELDHGIANLNAAKTKLEIYRQAVLKKAFEGELTKEWREQNPYSETDIDELLEYIEDFNAIKSGQDIPRRLPPIDLNYLYELPYGWIWQEAHKICSSVRDGTHDTPKYVEEGVPLVTSKNLKNGVIDIENVDLISEIDHEDICRRSAVEENDILYGMIGTIGNPVIVKQTKAFSIKNIGLFKKHETLLIPKYFQYYLSSWIVEHIMRQKELIRGTTQKFVALGGLRVLPIPLPSIKEQEQIIYVIESRLSVCDSILSNIEEGLEKSEALRQSILKKAFEGRLLSDEELAACRKEVDWEPAEKLLARIKEEKRTGR